MTPLQTLFLITQIALFRRIRPPLRAVKVDFKAVETELFICFFYDGEISSSEEKVLKEVVKKVSHDFAPSLTPYFIQRCDYPHPTQTNRQ